MIILVGVIKVTINHTSFEGNKIDSDLACESAKRLFREVVDRPPLEVIGRQVTIILLPGQFQ